MAVFHGLFSLYLLVKLVDLGYGGFGFILVFYIVVYVDKDTMLDIQYNGVLYF